MRDLPIGENRAHSIEINVTRGSRMASVFYTGTRSGKRTVEDAARADHLAVDTRRTAAQGRG